MSELPTPPTNKEAIPNYNLEKELDGANVPQKVLEIYGRLEKGTATLAGDQEKCGARLAVLPDGLDLAAKFFEMGSNTRRSGKVEDSLKDLHEEVKMIERQFTNKH